MHSSCLLLSVIVEKAPLKVHGLRPVAPTAVKRQGRSGVHCRELYRLEVNDSFLGAIALPESAPLESLLLKNNNLEQVTIPRCTNLDVETHIDLSHNNLMYDGSDGAYLSFLECSSLVEVHLESNENLHVNISSATFAPEFLTSTSSRVCVDDNQRENAIIDGSIDWNYDTDEGCYRYYP
jgi:hypothetical protein